MTDNMAGGGMAVGIDFETGYLKHYGYFFADGGSRRIEEHPELKFKVAYRNVSEVSLNGYSGYEMIEMFKRAGDIPENIYFSEEWIKTGLL